MRLQLTISMESMSEVTRILESIESGDPKAAEELLPLVYEELRRLAAAKMALGRRVRKAKSLAALAALIIFSTRAISNLDVVEVEACKGIPFAPPIGGALSPESLLRSSSPRPREQVSAKIQGLLDSPWV